MDKTAIKNFAISARRKLIENVSQKAYGIGISHKEIKEIEEVPDGSRILINNNYVYLNHRETENREKLIEQIQSKGYEQVIEEIAYTWFNRIIAIRFMEVNDYLPSGIRVLSSEEKGKIEPDAVTNAHDLIEELELNQEVVYNFQDNNDSENLFKYILIKQCNALGKIMPVMFEKIQDYTELLLPDNLLIEGSVVRDLVSNISEEDFKEQVEIIGWLYQYYISEKKDQVIDVLKGNKKLKKEEIPFATQLFTPKWIVKYMVENTLGKLWIDNNYSSKLKLNWEFFIDSKTDNYNKIDIKSPEDIKFIDPSVGSGHILVYAFDLLYQIYLDCGYSERDIPILILEKNIYGLDIDDRAGQLAYFAVIMKARSYSRRILRDLEKKDININICSIQESNSITNEDIEYFANNDINIKQDLQYILGLFKDAKEYGSLLNVSKINFDKIEKRLEEVKNEELNLFSKDNRLRIIEILPKLVKQAKIMTNKYDVCVTNPPYMNNKAMDKKLKLFVQKEYDDVKSDLFSVCIKRNFSYTKPYGYLGYMTPLVWMFIKSYEELRKYIINNKTITSLIQLQHDSAFEDVSVGICTFTFKNCHPKLEGEYFRLSDFYGIELQPIKVLEALKNKNVGYRYIYNQENFEVIPGNPIAYWTSSNIMNIFKNNNSIGNLIDVKKGMDTGSNEIFLRLWNEVNLDKIGIGLKSSEESRMKLKKWIPYNKGGDFRKWFGNNYYVVNWENDGEQLKKSTANIRSKHLYFKDSLTWTAISTGKLSIRSSKHGAIFDSAGSSMFPCEHEYNFYLGLMNSKVANYIIDMINPTLNYGSGTISKLPIIKSNVINKKLIDKYADDNIVISKKDWDSFETSWDFEKHPILEFKSNNIESSFNNWSEFTEKQFNQLKSNEEELNRIFIDIYGLQDELTPEVEDKDITIRKADRDREMKSFISYAVGCIMGRYSLDIDGLVFAGGEFDINKYKTLGADKDAIIPITDEEYFEDDIVSKFVEFVKAVFGEDSLEQNLNYIADTDCFKRKTNETSRDTIRRYFLKGFMEDHLKVYQKRPIYWMFDSGKQNGFKALIYMHRYDENMVGNIRANYLHILQRKYESEINRLDNDMNSEVLSTKEKATAKKLKEKIQKQLVECTSYDQVISHVAHQRISIDLDDGVKVNYQKFQGVEVPQGDGKKDLKADLLFKVKM